MPILGPDHGRSASERKWLRVYGYLQDNRYDLAVRAAEEYPDGMKVAGTPLLAAPSWLPGKPVPLRDVDISLRPGAASAPRIRGTDVAAIAPGLLPERRDGSPYRTQSEAIQELSPPAVFENRPAYRLTEADLRGDRPRLEFTLGRFFDGTDVGGAAGHESAAAELGVVMTLKLRNAIKDPCDLSARPHAMAVGALTLRYDRETGTAQFPVHWRDPKRVGHAGGLFQVIPVGIFQPSGEAEWNVANDFSLWHGLLREYAEELLGAGEDHGSETAPLDYGAWPFARRMTGALEDGRIRAWCLGLGTDPLTMAMDLLTVVVIDAPLYDELFGASVTDNEEGRVLPLRPFTPESVGELLDDHPVQAAGAGLLTLALAHRDTLLARLSSHTGPRALLFISPFMPMSGVNVNIALWIVAGLLAAMFLIAGAMKVAAPKEKLESTIMVWSKAWSRPQLQALGAVEILAAIGLILPRTLNIAPVLTPIAAIGCAVVMIGAVITHTRMKDYTGISMPVVLLILAAVVAVGRS